MDDGRSMATSLDSPPQGNAKRRIPYFDNVKFFLIVCVVLGHAIKLGPTDTFDSARSLSVFIYSFHMPLFIFLSGLLLNRQRMTAKKVWTNAALYLAYGYLAKLLRASVPFAVAGVWQVSLFSEVGLPWYMFALAAFYALAWLLRSCNFVLVGVLSVVAALAAGTNPQIGAILCLSRILVFFPFFWLGHALDPQRVTRLFARRDVKIACLCVLVAFACACIRWPGELYPYRSLFLGRDCYELCEVEGCGWQHRLLAYAMSLAMGAAVMGVVPQGNVPVASKLGSRTLWVYLLHHEVLDVMRFAGVGAWLVASEWRWLVLVPFSFALACVLSLPIPVNPFAAMMKKEKGTAQVRA